MKITKKHKAWIAIALILLPLFVGATVIVFQNKKRTQPAKQPGAKGIPTPTPKSAPVALTSDQSSSCTYPLKVGSNNACVGQLQAALGVPVDNDFGTVYTEPALLAQTGKSQIDNAQDLQDTINSIIAANTPIDPSVYATASQDILNKYQADSSLTYIKIVNPTNMSQVNQELVTTPVSWAPIDSPTPGNGYWMSLPAGNLLSLDMYKPFAIDPATGYLILNCVGSPNGNDGYWMANPFDLTVSSDSTPLVLLNPNSFFLK